MEERALHGTLLFYLNLVSKYCLSTCCVLDAVGEVDAVLALRKPRVWSVTEKEVIT